MSRFNKGRRLELFLPPEFVEQLERAATKSGQTFTAWAATAMAAAAGIEYVPAKRGRPPIVKPEPAKKPKARKRAG